MIRVQIVGGTAAPRALVVEQPPWWHVLLGAVPAEWYAFAAPAPAGGLEWYRDSAEERPRRVVRRRVLDELERALTRSIAARRIAALPRT